MQFKIPQDVQMEDKIVGPLTLRQLMIMAAGGTIDYFLYLSLANMYVLVVWIIPVALVAIVTLSIAFIKIQGMRFTHYVLFALEFYFKPRQRLWISGGGEVFSSITMPHPKTKDELNQEKQNKAPIQKPTQSLSELSKMLNMHQEMLDSEDASPSNAKPVTPSS